MKKKRLLLIPCIIALLLLTGCEKEGAEKGGHQPLRDTSKRRHQRAQRILCTSVPRRTEKDLRQLLTAGV